MSNTSLSCSELGWQQSELLTFVSCEEFDTESSRLGLPLVAVPCPLD